jgi:hypothetical protein
MVSQEGRQGLRGSTFLGGMAPRVVDQVRRCVSYAVVWDADNHLANTCGLAAVVRCVTAAKSVQRPYGLVVSAVGKVRLRANSPMPSKTWARLVVTATLMCSPIDTRWWESHFMVSVTSRSPWRR